MKTTTPKTHIGLYVSNIDKTISFYTKFFGIKPTKVKSDYAKFELESPSLVISFVVDDKKVSSDFGHLGIQVASAEELELKFDAVKQVGLEYLEENQVSCCYALQDKFWVADPDGIRWEVYQFHEDVEHNDSHETTQCCTTSKSDKEETCCEAESQCC